MTKKKVTEQKHKQNKVADNQEYIKDSEVTQNDQAGDRNEASGAGDSGDPEIEPADAVTESQSINELTEKLAELQDRYLRLSAEFDNYRKRTLREKIELTKTASESVLLKLIPVLDDFERGMKLMESATDCKALKEGIDLIYLKFRNFLDQSGVREIEAMNLEFNVDLHDAVTKVAAPDENLKGRIVDVLEKGYTLNDKVIRFSKVVVGE